MNAPSLEDRAWSFLRRVSSSYVGGFDFVHGLLSEMLAAVRAEGIARGREEEERARVVKRLRDEASTWPRGDLCGDAFNEEADAIEAGMHARADHAPAGETKRGEGET